MPIDPPDSPTKAPPSPFMGKPAPSRRPLKIAAIAGACVAALVVVTGVVSRAHDTSQTKTWTSAQQIPGRQHDQPVR